MRAKMKIDINELSAVNLKSTVKEVKPTDAAQLLTEPVTLCYTLSMDSH